MAKRKTVKKSSNKQVKYMEYLIFLTKRGMSDIGDMGKMLFGVQLQKLEKEYKLLKN